MRKFFKALKNKINFFTYTRQEKRHSQVGAPELWKMKRDFQIGFLKKERLKPEDSLLDIGCGTLRGGIPIIEYLETGHYYGIEARSETLEEGRKELVEAGLEHKSPVLVSSPDILKVNIEKRFEFIWSFSTLIHMTDSILSDTIKFVGAHLLETGVFYANVNIGTSAERTWQGFPVVWRPIAFYQEACAAHGLALEDMGTLRDLGHTSKIESQDSQRMLKIIQAH